LQSDGYAGYDIFKDHPDITLFYCMAHARRKFHEALSNDKERASYALSQIQQLYAIERHCRQNSIAHEALKQYLLDHAAPVLQALRTWMQQAYAEVLPKSAIGKALDYSLQRWDGLSLYATNGMLNIDNNPVENSIRPVALGRKNYLFAGSHAAAERGAIFYSLFATCKVHGVNPYDWLKDVLDKLAYWKLVNIDELLPQNWVKLNG
jgi:transposase